MNRPRLVNSRRRNRTFTARLLSSPRRPISRFQVRYQDKLIGRRRLEVRDRNTNSTRALLLPTKRYTQVPVVGVNGSRAVRLLGDSLTNFVELSSLKVRRQFNRVLRYHLIRGRIMILGRRPSFQARLIGINEFNDNRVRGTVARVSNAKVHILGRVRGTRRYKFAKT